MQLQQPQQPVDPRLHGAQSAPLQPGWTGPPMGGYVPYNDLQSRLMAQAHASRSALQGMAAYFIAPPAAILGGVLYVLFILPFSFGASSASPDLYMGWILGAPFMGLVGTVGGGLLGYFLAMRALQARFDRAHAETLDLLQNTELPLLIADEGYCAGLLDTLSTRNRFLFTGPPSIRRLEDQLSIAACYVRALRSGRFLADEVSPALLKHGSGRWWTTTPSARTLNLLTSLSFCLGSYCGCLFMIPLARNVLVLSEQRGTLVAVCEYFAGAHEVRGD